MYILWYVEVVFINLMEPTKDLLFRIISLGLSRQEINMTQTTAAICLHPMHVNIKHMSINDGNDSKYPV